MEEISNVSNQELLEIDLTDGSAININTNQHKQVPIGSLVDLWKMKELIIPSFQRKYVWSINQASKFIDSLLRGLPIPTLMFYQDSNARQVVIDGQQRLKTILFFRGDIPSENLTPEEKKMLNFRLKGLSKDNKYYDIKYSELDEETKRKFNYLTNLDINLIVLNNPDDLTDIYYIFERLNTGGTLLTAQEIRSCICSGTFNDFIIELNNNPQWQEFFTADSDKIHQKDVELILRFFALFDCLGEYKRPMKDFLTNYFKRVKNISNHDLEEKRLLFNNVVLEIYNNIGAKAFHRTKQLNSSVADAVMIAFANNLDNVPQNICARYRNLKENEEFVKFVSKSSDDVASVNGRIKLAEKILFEDSSEYDEKIITLYNLPSYSNKSDWTKDKNIFKDNLSTKNRRADYAIRIQDDSMSPYIKNGNIVLIKRTHIIKSGNIGIFTYSNTVYCRRYMKLSDNTYLTSENEDYRTIKIEKQNNLIINGIVVGILPISTSTL